MMTTTGSTDHGFQLTKLITVRKESSDVKPHGKPEAELLPQMNQKPNLLQAAENTQKKVFFPPEIPEVLKQEPKKGAIPFLLRLIGINLESEPKNIVDRHLFRLMQSLHSLMEEGKIKFLTVDDDDSWYGPEKLILNGKPYMLTKRLEYDDGPGISFTGEAVHYTLCSEDGQVIIKFSLGSSNYKKYSNVSYQNKTLGVNIQKCNKRQVLKLGNKLGKALDTQRVAFREATKREAQTNLEQSLLRVETLEV